MPNIQINSLKNTIPRLASQAALNQFLIDNALSGFPFGTFQDTEREYDLAAVILARAIEWEVELDFTWTASISSGGDTDSVVAHVRGTGTISDPAPEAQSYSGYTGIDPTDPLPSGPVPAVLEEETMAHPDARIGSNGTFTPSVFPDREFETTHNADPPVDNSASLTDSGTLNCPICVFGGAFISVGWQGGWGAGHFGPAPGGMGAVISDGAGYTEQIGYPDTSTNPEVYPAAVECGTFTFVWFHADGGTQSASCPIYTVDMSVMSAGVGTTTSRTVSCDITMTQTGGLRYGDTYLPSGEKA